MVREEGSLLCILRLIIDDSRAAWEEAHLVWVEVLQVWAEAHPAWAVAHPVWVAVVAADRVDGKEFLTHPLTCRTCGPSL